MDRWIVVEDSHWCALHAVCRAQCAVECRRSSYMPLDFLCLHRSFGGKW